MHGAIAHDWDHCASCVGPLYIMYEANAHDWDIVHYAWGHCTLCMGPMRMIGTIVHHAWGHCTLCISQCAWLGPLCIMRGAIAHYVWGHSPLHTMYGTIAHHAWGHCVLCMEPLHIMHGAIAHHSWAIVHDAWGHCTWCMWPLPIMHGPLCSICRANALCACMKTVHSGVLFVGMLFNPRFMKQQFCTQYSSTYSTVCPTNHDSTFFFDCAVSGYIYRWFGWV